MPILSNVLRRYYKKRFIYIYIYRGQDMYVLMRKERGRSFDSRPMRKFSYKRFLSGDLFSPTGQPRNEIGKVDFINDHTGT